MKKYKTSIVVSGVNFGKSMYIEIKLFPMVRCKEKR